MIRRKIPILGAAVLVALALGAVAASAAQAGEWEWEIGGATGVTSEPFAGSSSNLEITGTVLGAQVQVSCPAGSSGTLKLDGKSSATLALSSCSVAKPANCTLEPSSLTMKGEQVDVGGEPYEKFVPAEGTKFGTLKLRGEFCGQEGNYALTGSIAGVDLEGPGQAVERPLTFSAAAATAAGTKLLLNGSSGSLTGVLTQHVSGTQAGSAYGLRKKGTQLMWVNEVGNPFTVSQGVTLNATKALSFSTKVLGATIAFTCSSSQAKGGLLVPSNSFTGSLEFLGCVMSESPNCSIQSTIKTNPVQGVAKNIGGLAYETFSAASGGTLMNWIISGEKCVLAGNYPITGSVSGQGEPIGTLLQAQPLTFSPSVDKTAGSALKFGTSQAELSGQMAQELTNGAKSGLAYR